MRSGLTRAHSSLYTALNLSGKASKNADVLFLTSQLAITALHTSAQTGTEDQCSSSHPIPSSEPGQGSQLRVITVLMWCYIAILMIILFLQAALCHLAPYFACYSISHSLYSHSRKLLSYFHVMVLTGLSTLRGSPVQMTGIQVNIQLGW